MPEIKRDFHFFGKVTTPQKQNNEQSPQTNLKQYDNLELIHEWLKPIKRGACVEDSDKVWNMFFFVFSSEFFSQNCNQKTPGFFHNSNEREKIDFASLPLPLAAFAWYW